MKTKDYLLIGAAIVITGLIVVFALKKKKPVEAEVKTGEAQVKYTGERKFTGVTNVYLEKGTIYNDVIINKDGSATFHLEGSYGTKTIKILPGEFTIVKYK